MRVVPIASVLNLHFGSSVHAQAEEGERTRPKLYVRNAPLISLAIDFRTRNSTARSSSRFRQRPSPCTNSSSAPKNARSVSGTGSFWLSPFSLTAPTCRRDDRDEGSAEIQYVNTCPVPARNLLLNRVSSRADKFLKAGTVMRNYSHVSRIHGPPISSEGVLICREWRRSSSCSSASVSFAFTQPCSSTVRPISIRTGPRTPLTKSFL